MRRQARCWVCGVWFEAERGTLARGARFTCVPCAEEGLGAVRPDRVLVARVLYERHGVPYAELSGVAIDAEVLRLVPEEFARHHAAIPIARREKTRGKRAIGAPVVELVVAMADPTNEFAIESLRRRAGLVIAPFVAPWADIQEAIAEAYLPIALEQEPSPE